jgi:cyanophycin synthetase
MKILKINILRGPNYWSNYRKKLIVITLDLEEYKDVLTNQIEEFSAQLKSLIPSLFQHRCSIGSEGGFFIRLAEGTLLSHVIEHVALELQTLAGMDCGFGRVRSTNQEGVFHVVFSYQIESAGLYAAKKAIEIVQTLAKQKKYQYLAENINELKNIYSKEKLGPSTEAIIKEAAARDIPSYQLDESLIMLGQGANQKIILATMGNNTSSIGVDIVADKNLTKKLLSSEFIPVPKGVIVNSLEAMYEEIESLGFPLVIKSRYGNHGRGITTNIMSQEKAIVAFNQAKKISNSVVVEKYIAGFDYRFLLINFKVVAVAKRTPARVIGNGFMTIQELIDEVNKDPKRGEFHENHLTKIKIDEMTLSILNDKGLTLDSILPENEILNLKDTANLSTGGTAVDVTESVHPHNIFLAERAARLINLDVCGIDVIAKDISKPLTKENGAFIEINAAPGFRMHLFPTSGEKRNVAKNFVDMLYPDNKPARIPIVAVTGTNGKTTVVRLISHIASQLNYCVGMTTTEGIYIDNREIYVGDCSGPSSALCILRDPLVNFAVLECARGGILRSGLGFDKCNVSIVTNISEDHLGLNDIHTLEKMAQVKSVVPHSTDEEGYAILNAEDDLVYKMHEELHCKVALFSLNKNERIINHITNNQLCCYVENNLIYIHDNNKCIEVMNINDIPCTLGGKFECMKRNILPVILACWVRQFPIETISKCLKSFFPTAENLPGRMNLFKFDNCTVMLDYAHNENAYVLLQDYVNSINASKKIGIIAGTGDRRSIDIWKLGYYAAQMFDEIIIRHDKDSRERTNKEITDLIIEGVKHVHPNKSIQIISEEGDAIEYAILNAESDTFIWYFPENVLNAVKFLNQFSKTNVQKSKVD